MRFICLNFMSQYQSSVCRTESHLNQIVVEHDPECVIICGLYPRPSAAFLQILAVG